MLYELLQTHSKPFQCQESPHKTASILGHLRKNCRSIHGIELPIKGRTFHKFDLKVNEDDKAQYSFIS